MLVTPPTAGTPLAKDSRARLTDTFRRPDRKLAICRTAQGLSEHLQAFGCLYESYRRSGLCQPCKSQVRILPFHLWDQTQTFVCLKDERAIGTVSLVLDSPEGLELPSEHAFGSDIDRLRQLSHRIAEITSLAVAPTDARTSSELFARLTSTAIYFARRHGVDRAVATVHPRHARVYQRVMGFDRIGQVAPHGGVL